MKEWRVWIEETSIEDGEKIVADTAQEAANKFKEAIGDDLFPDWNDGDRVHLRVAPWEELPEDEDAELPEGERFGYELRIEFRIEPFRCT